MAFEKPLEADRVDDSGLFMSIVRAPVGILIWALGGSGNEEQKSQRQEVAKQLMKDTEEDETERHSTSFLKKVPSNLSDLKKAMPSMAHSEVSDMSDSPHGSQQSLNGDSLRKHLSWSDESGQNLVYYQDESATRHTPPRPEIAPLRPALSRSQSVHNRLANKESRYLPKALAQPRDKHIVNSYSSSDSTNDIESPQWGWYIRTTPPTPEMYANFPVSKTYSTNSTVMPHSMPMSHPNPVFQGLQDKNRGSPMGWPSVPL